MATNLEKLKAEIAEMSAEEFAEEMAPGSDCHDFVCKHIGVCRPGNCHECRVTWLNEESEAK